MKNFKRMLAKYGPIDSFCCKQIAEDFYRAALEWALDQAGWEREDITQAIEQELEDE